MTDEKLNECCAATHGVYIKGIMCLMHKSETYGKILLKQKYKQSESKEKNFALMLANHLPYTVDIIFAALTELIQEDVCQFEGDYLVQKRMVRDAELSEKRSLSGSKGGKVTQNNANKFAKAKDEANTEYEYEYIISILNSTEVYALLNINTETEKNFSAMIVLEMVKIWQKYFPEYDIDPKSHYPSFLQIAYKIARMKKWNGQEVLNGKMNEAIISWDSIVKFISKDKWLNTRSIMDIAGDKDWDRLMQKMRAEKEIKTAIPTPNSFI